MLCNYCHTSLIVLSNRPSTDLPTSPTSCQQPTRPASTQPVVTHHQPNHHPIQRIPPHTANSAIPNQKDSRPLQQVYSSTPSHVTDPRTGQYRPHSAQLPRKQYDFNTGQYPRHTASGYSTGDRYRRGSEGGMETEPWGNGAPNTSRNPPRRSGTV